LTNGNVGSNRPLRGRQMKRERKNERVPLLHQLCRYPVSSPEGLGRVRRRTVGLVVGKSLRLGPTRKEAKGSAVSLERIISAWNATAGGPVCWAEANNGAPKTKNPHNPNPNPNTTPDPGGDRRRKKREKEKKG